MRKIGSKFSAMYPGYSIFFLMLVTHYGIEILFHDDCLLSGYKSGFFLHCLAILNIRMISVDYRRSITGALLDFRKRSMFKQIFLCG